MGHVKTAQGHARQRLAQHLKSLLPSPAPSDFQTLQPRLFTPGEGHRQLVGVQRGPREAVSQAAIHEEDFVGSHFQNYLDDLPKNKWANAANQPAETRQALHRMELNEKLMRVYNGSRRDQNSARTKDVSLLSKLINTPEF